MNRSKFGAPNIESPPLELKPNDELQLGTNYTEDPNLLFNDRNFFMKLKKNIYFFPSPLKIY